MSGRFKRFPACVDCGMHSRRLGSARSNRRSQAGQMTVELAVLLPVIAAVAFITTMGMMFAGECAAFDIAFRESVRLQADDGWDNDSTLQIETELAERLPSLHGSVAVSCERAGVGHARYKGVLTFEPPFLRGVSIFGVAAPALRHEAEFAVSPYRKGVLA